MSDERDVLVGGAEPLEYSILQWKSLGGGKQHAIVQEDYDVNGWGAWEEYRLLRDNGELTLYYSYNLKQGVRSVEVSDQVTLPATFDDEIRAKNHAEEHMRSGGWHNSLDGRESQMPPEGA